MSQRIRDRDDQFQAYSRLGESLPKWIEATGLIGFIAWEMWSLRPRVDVYPNPKGPYIYKGQRTGYIEIVHPYGRGGPFVMGELLLLLNLPSGDWFELAEDALIFGFYRDLYDNFLFSEENILPEVKQLPQPPVKDATVIVMKAVISRWIAVFAHASFMAAILKRGILPPST